MPFSGRYSRCLSCSGLTTTSKDSKTTESSCRVISFQFRLSSACICTHRPPCAHCYLPGRCYLVFSSCCHHSRALSHHRLDTRSNVTCPTNIPWGPGFWLFAGKIAANLLQPRAAHSAPRCRFGRAQMNRLARSYIIGRLHGILEHLKLPSSVRSSLSVVRCVRSSV
jgi:hypothetical protein